MPSGFCSVAPGKGGRDCTESTARNPWWASYGHYMTVLDEAPGESTGEPVSEPTDARGRVAELHEIRARALAGPSEKATQAQHAKGKL
ncbi:methylmalonyl-CoA carboxyltransferase, partial [Streptomyces sp. NPDC047043]